MMPLWERDEVRAGLRAQLAVLGFASLENALDADLLGRMQAEAAERRAMALCADGDEEVAYRAHVVDLGAVARDFLSGAKTERFLVEVFGTRLVLTDDASCYTYYGEGDKLGLHRDRPHACVATLILYLAVQGAATGRPASGLSLRVFGQTRPPPDAPPAVVIPTRIGTLVVGWGASVWHERPLLLGGESVAALTACYGRSET
jgi:hypothetical protein